MKMIRNLVLAAFSFAAVCSPSVVLAQTSPTAPVVVPHDGTGGLPPEIKTLITGFDATRDSFLTEQATLLGQLKSATTAAEREQIRDELQGNRQAYLAALKAFRTQLKDDLAALKGKISHAEFLRIIEAAHNAATEGGRHHHKAN